MNATEVAAILSEVERVRDSADRMRVAAIRACTHYRPDGSAATRSRYPGTSFAGLLECTACGQEVEEVCRGCAKYNSKNMNPELVCQCATFTETLRTKVDR